jgi:putative ABC transport system permease protein
MKALELFRLAISRLGTSRLRTFLTMLGIIIGVASVVALVSVGQGATSGITNRLQSLGTNLLTVNAGATFRNFTRGAAGSASTLTLDDASAIAALEGIAAVAPEASAQALIVAGTQNTTTTLLGTLPAYAVVRNFSLWQGTFLNDASVEQGLRVAVLGATTADDLGLGAGAIGQQVLIAGLPFEVIGILQPKGSAGPSSADDQVIIPLSTFQQHFVKGNTVRTISVSVARSDGIAAAKTLITATLEQRHGITGTKTDDFTIQDQTQLLETASSVGDLLSILLAGIASISLLVGGIGIMNIMLVSVRERTREIGIRKAIGARGSDILLQFLIEALTISLVGGLIGILLGIGATAVIGVVGGWGFQFNPVTVVVALVFSLAVGVIFGVWPARQAARLDPIMALHYE